MLAFAGCAHTPQGTQPQALFINNQWSGPIWIPAEPDFEELVAAEELADWCERVTGIRPEVRLEQGTTARTGIALGNTKLARRAELLPAPRDGDTATRKWWGDTLVLVGNSPMATRMACGRFAEAALGLTFALPSHAGADYAPLELVSPPADEVWVPAVAWRAISGMRGPDAIAWARLNGYGERPRCTHGIHLAFTPELFAQRPELFAQLDGEALAPTQRGRSANPDLSHPDAAPLAAAAAFAWLTANPSQLAVPMGINDSVVYPDIPEAWPGEGVVDGRPNRSDFVFGFLNEVAALNWNPGGDHALGALAYLDAQAPPSFPVHPDIFPAVCADRIQYAIPAYAKEESERLAAWGKSGVKRLGTWDYWFGRDVPFPRVHFGALASSIKAAQSAGVDSWYAELDPLWIFDAPKAWVGSRLLSDPEADVQQLQAHWFTAAYGPAAPAMLKFYEDVGRAWEATLAERIPGQWLLGWRDSGFRVADYQDLLGARGLAYLKDAREALAAAPSDARHRRMRQRLTQFELAWTAVRTHHARQEQARLIIRSGTTASAVAFDAMLNAEYARRDALIAFHAAPWPSQENLEWIKYSEPNPWPLIVGPTTRVPADAPAEAKLAVIASQRKRAKVTATSFSFRGLPVDYEGWRIWVAAPGTYEVSAEGVEALAPQGRMHRTFPVAAGEILRIRITVQDDHEPGNGATLKVRFPKSTPTPPKVDELTGEPLTQSSTPHRRGLSRTIRLVPGLNVLEVPVRPNDGNEAEVEIAFIDRLARIGLVEIDRLPR